MKSIFLSTTLMVIMALTSSFAQSIPDWENPEIFDRNQTEPHTTLMPYATLKQALTNQRKSSPFHLTLNGTWKFSWAENPEQAPGDFYKKGYDTSGWDEIKVPSNWQMQGFGYPMFRNIGQPFSHRPPEVPKAFNPVGSYIRMFELPDDWNQHQIFLHFEGVHSASKVWINGHWVGYNQGGMEPAEYDITEYIKTGKNNIAVQVLRFSDGAYMEDQDMWRLSGIYRDVYLMATPKIHIRDFYLTTDLDTDYQDAILNIQADVKNYYAKNISGHAVRVQLYKENKTVFATPLSAQLETLASNEIAQISLSQTIKNPKKWSAEHPNLYTVTLELIDQQGETVEILSSRIGFRKVEVKNQAIYVNGVPIKFNGVNSHMQHPETGHCMDEETLRKDLTLMKQFNINCVRTSHYPPNVEYLDIADELGMYVVDETGDEAHAYIDISHKPEWRAQYLDRVRQLVHRDRNHPCVVIWSAGNESGPGDNICAVIAEGKKIDPSRPAWMYGGNRDRNPKTNPIKCEDIVGPRYLEPFILKNRFAKIPETVDPRPSFMDEYIAATGNSLGGLEEYWDLIYRYPRLTGGAIWDWVSPGITWPVIFTPDGSKNDVQCALMGKAQIRDSKFGKALALSGHDEWVEVYRHPALDISGNNLTLSAWVYPYEWNGHAYFITKSQYQYGLIQSRQDSLEFYIFTHQKQSVFAHLPDDWENNWHHIAGIYDGEDLKLYIDGNLQAGTVCTGSILDGPYAVNIGKSSEIIDSHLGPLCHAMIDRVRIFDTPVPIQDLYADAIRLKSKACLWLDFEKTEEAGAFYSIGIPGRTYGVVWPDRSVQPELWQLKKTPQPVDIKAIDLKEGKLSVFNRHHFTNLGELDGVWSLYADDKIIEQGTLDLDIAPLQKKTIQISYSKPTIEPGEHYFLMVQIKLAEKKLWADAGHEIAWEQFELPYYQEAEPTKGAGSSRLMLKKTAESVMITGDHFSYIWDKTTGLIESVQYKSTELIKQGPKFNVWRAPLANDLDQWAAWGVDIGQTQAGLKKDIANGWRSIGLNRLVHDLETFEIDETNDNAVTILTTYSVSANNYTSGFDVKYDYTLFSNGELLITVKSEPQGRMTHWLPKLGLQFKVPKAFQNLKWYGRGPFENYPDRKTGAKIGIYENTVENEYVPYLIPQDYGNKTDVHWLSITNQSGTGLFIAGKDLIHFSAQKYDIDNLTRAYYAFQLLESKDITLNIDHRVSGVGGTANSVLNEYRVLPDEYEFTVIFRPFSMKNTFPEELGKSY